LLRAWLGNTSLHILITLNGRILESLDDVLSLIDSLWQPNGLLDRILLPDLINGCTFIMRSFDIDNLIISAFNIVRANVDFG
jgi:hypothetical protein